MPPILPRILRPYTEEEYAFREVVTAVLMLVGMVWLVILVMNGWPAGILSAFAAVFTGAAFGCYRTRRTEPGVWMLALLIGVGVVAAYVLAMVMEILDSLRGLGPNPWWVAADVSLSGAIVSMAARGSWTVFVQNRGLSKRS